MSDTNGVLLPGRIMCRLALYSFCAVWVSLHVSLMLTRCKSSISTANTGCDKALQELKCVGPALAQCVHGDLTTTEYTKVAVTVTMLPFHLGGRATCCPSVGFYLCRQYIGVYWKYIDWSAYPNRQACGVLAIVSIRATDGVADMITRRTPYNYKAPRSRLSQ